MNASTAKEMLHGRAGMGVRHRKIGFRRARPIQKGGTRQEQRADDNKKLG